MKKILFLNSEFPPIGGGASPVSYEIALKLSENGYDIDVVTAGYKKLPKFEEINEHLRIHRVKCLRSKKEISTPIEQLSYLVSAFFKAFSLHKKKQFDFSYAHFIIPTGALALALKLITGLKYLISAHGSDVIGHNSRFKVLYKVLVAPWKLILNNAEKITVPSQHLFEKLTTTHSHLSADKVIILPNIVKSDIYKPMNKEKYILTVSRINPQKGIQDLLTAFANTKNFDWKIKIVGEGPYKENLQKIAVDLDISKQVEFVGWASTLEKKQDLYGHAAIYVNPSYAESFGITTIEAMQAGCHCIISETGIAKQLQNVKTFRPGDIKTLQEHLNEAFTSDKLTLSSDHELFTEEKVVPLLLNILQSM